MQKIIAKNRSDSKALDGIRTHDLRFTKPSLCQAELLGHVK
jgi:hypothetical protein